MKMFLFINLILIMILLLTMTISKKSFLQINKSSPFECGFTPLSNSRKSFSIQFFLIALLFLVFDVELSVIMPMAFLKTIKLTEWFKSSMIILIILIFGLLNEWNQGMMEWMK
nr:NADH dehydrogenase subunit 3 [Kinnaridae sp.]